MTARLFWLMLLCVGFLLGGCPSGPGTLTAGDSSGTGTTAGASTSATDLSAQYPDCAAVSDPAAFAAEVLRLVNVERTNRGLDALSSGDVLAEQAMLHACEMIQYNFFAHENPRNGSTPGDRIAASGFPARAWGENIAAGQNTPQEVVTGWMNSDGHRANILHADYTHLGVGVRRGGYYGIYWVQLFAG